MESIRFNTTISENQIIQPPKGIKLPEGKVEVTVCPIATETAPSANTLASKRAWLLALATEAESEDPDLPTDMAENHDHYAHGKPIP